MNEKLTITAEFPQTDVAAAHLLDKNAQKKKLTSEKDN